MRELLSFLGKSGVGLHHLLVVGMVAVAAGALAMPVWLGASSGRTVLSAAQQPLQTPTATATSTATFTQTATLTATATATATATGVVTGTVTVTATAEPKVTICHRTGSLTNPYNMISVSVNAVPAHTGHGDIIPAPAGGCPATAVTGTPSTTGTPTATGTVVATGTAAAKVTICHRTGSQTNPYNMISVSVNAVPAHTGHGDIVPAPAGGCPSAAPSTKPNVKKSQPKAPKANPPGQGQGQNKAPASPPGQEKGKGGGDNGNKGGKKP